MKSPSEAPSLLNTIESALLALDSVCDGAQSDDGHGYNGRDSGFGKSLAAQIRDGRTLSVGQNWAAYKMLRTYRRQLGDYGIDYEQIPPPPEVPLGTGVFVGNQRHFFDQAIDDAGEERFESVGAKPLTAREILGPGGVIAQQLPGYEHRESQLAMATLVETALAAGEHAVVEAGTGCIQGDAEITCNRSGLGRPIKLRDIVSRFNGGGGETSRRAYPWDLTIPTFVQQERDGVVRLARLKAAWCSGEKETFTVTTESNRQIRATGEHPFLTERGWLQLRELQVGDLVHVRGHQATTGRQIKPRYHTVYRMHAHPYAHYRPNGSAGVEEHRLVAEATVNGLGYREYTKRLVRGEIEGLTFINPREFEVHHIDHDSENNDPSNLAVLDATEHARLHAIAGTSNNVLYKVATERIVSVEPFGTEITYDLEVEDDFPHNFIANGFVVHNTGKSLAYLVPAILGKETAIVSTADKSLQAQIVTKDIPFLQSVMPVPFRAALLKGRANYACLQAISELETAGQQEALTGFGSAPAGFASRADAEQWPLVRTWLKETNDGDVDALAIPLSASLRASITTDSDGCLGHKCPHYDVCWAERAKQNATYAKVIIVNHALLLRDLQLRHATEGHVGVIPSNPKVVIIDEAHHLEDIASDQLGVEIRGSRWERLAKRLERLTVEHADVKPNPNETAGEEWAVAQNWSQNTTALSADLTAALTSVTGMVSAKLHGREGSVAERLGTVPALRDLSARMAFFAKEMGDDVPYWLREEAEREAWNKLAQAVNRFAEDLGLCGAGSTAPKFVQFAELTVSHGSARLVLHAKPIEVAEQLKTLLWDAFPSVIATSATIATGTSTPQWFGEAVPAIDDTGAFSYWLERTGCEDARTLLALSPFDYTHQALLYLPPNGAQFDSSSARKGGEAGSVEYLDRMATEIEQLILASDGRAFCLFTSFRALEEVHRRLSPRLSHWLVLKQGDYPRPELVRRFREHGSAVLFGVKSFWEGVDVGGQALSLVVIDKLPFPPPDDPVWQAKCDAINRRMRNEWAWFNELAIPYTTIALKQGFGRLIRTGSDRGVVALLDGRLTSKGYGSRVLKALPPATQTRSLDAVRAFFGGHA